MNPTGVLLPLEIPPSERISTLAEEPTVAHAVTVGELADGAGLST
jgi:hypothetical protein